MNTIFALLLGFLQASPFIPPRLEQTAGLEYPFTTTGTQWVILDLETSRQRSVQSVQVLQGASPFLELALTNVRQWEFTPAATSGPVESHVTAVFMFRPRDIFSGSPVSMSQLYRRNADRAPFPIELSDPGYPVSSVGEGAAILEMQVAESGTIDRVRVLRDEAGLAAHTEKTARTWKFQPAMRNGSVSAGSVVVVAWYLRPILYNHPPYAGGPYYPHEPNVPPPAPPAPSIFRDGGTKPRGL